MAKTDAHKSLMSQCSNDIYDLWEFCIKNGLDTCSVEYNMWTCYNMTQFNKMKKIIKDKIGNRSYTTYKRRKVSLPKIPHQIRKLSKKEQFMYHDILIFERNMFNLELKTCLSCTGKSLSYNFKLSNGVCDECNEIIKDFDFKKSNIKGRLPTDVKAKMIKDHLLKNNMLPVWYEKHDVNKTNPIYEIPHELKKLTLGEKLLIQWYAPIVPIYHLSMGHKGLKGHCCCFFQDTQKICDDLPRKTSTIVRVLRNVTEGSETVQKNFLINKNRVLTALE